MDRSLNAENIDNLLGADRLSSEGDRLYIESDPDDPGPSGVCPGPSGVCPGEQGPLGLSSNTRHEVPEHDSDLSDLETEFSDHLTESEFELSETSSESECDDDDRTEHQQPIRGARGRRRAIGRRVLSSSSVTQRVPASANYFYGRGRDPYKWAKKPPSHSRTRSANIIVHIPGIKGPIKDGKPQSPLEVRGYLFTEDIVNIVLESTNKKITEMASNYKEIPTFAYHVSMEELKAFIGLLILSGVFKSGHEDATSLFSSDGTGRDIFRATMSLKRFLFLLISLRFDDQDTREERKSKGDKLAPISEIFHLFVENCKNNYSCSEYATVDEMLVGFRGRCSFRQYIKSKPRKYGLKILCLCDAKTHYLSNAFVYVGKTQSQPNPKKLSKPTLTVLQLCDSLKGTNRNITGDNWFSSLELVEELRQNKLTYVGTVRKNKREVPVEFLPNKHRKAQSSVFGFTSNNTLVSYVPKKYRSVILVSSMHHDATVTEDESKKPEIIQFYNMTKSGVDSLDQKCTVYSCQRRTRRWPQALFFAMLDISRVNSFVLLKATNAQAAFTHRTFAISLGRALLEDHIKIRSQSHVLQKDIRLAMSKVFGEDLMRKQPTQTRGQDARAGRGKQRRCHLCPRIKDKKVKSECCICNQAVCKDLSVLEIKCNDCK